MLQAEEVQREPTLEQYTRELYNLPPNWNVVIWKSLDDKRELVSVTGAVMVECFKRGPRKGRSSWKKRDRETELTTVISRSSYEKWLLQWEAEMAKCHKCSGTGQEFASWSSHEGIKHRDCSRCGATGKPPIAMVAP